jgi:hypothetical protein
MRRVTYHLIKHRAASSSKFNSRVQEQKTLLRLGSRSAFLILLRGACLTFPVCNSFVVLALSGMPL